MKEKLNKFMENLKKQNPNASWANLLTGIAVLVMVAVFSYAYFSRSKTQNVTIDDSKLLEQVTKGEESKGEEQKEEKQESKDQGAGTSTGQEKQGDEQKAEPGEKGAEVSAETTVVQKGEGLWHVAQRVCGDGEKYNILAAANGLSVWDELNEGMTLKVVCK